MAIGLLALDMKAAQAWAAKNGFVQVDSFEFRSRGLQRDNDFGGDTLVYANDPTKLLRFDRGAEVVVDGSFEARPLKELNAFDEIIRARRLKVRR